MSNVMQVSRVMDWVDYLPEVTADIKKARDEVRELVAEANQLETQAAEKREAAYRASLTVESRARGTWTLAAVEEAKRRADR